MRNLSVREDKVVVIVISVIVISLLAPWPMSFDNQCCDVCPVSLLMVCAYSLLCMKTDSIADARSFEQANKAAVAPPTAMVGVGLG